MLFNPTSIELEKKSTNGKTWEIIYKDTNYSYNSIAKAIYGNGIWVSAGSDRLSYSYNGKKWFRGQSDDVSLEDLNNWDGLLYENGVWIAWVGSSGSSRILRSTDGINWELASCPSNFSYITLAYGNGMWVAGSNSKSGSYGTYYSLDNCSTWIKGTWTTSIIGSIVFNNGVWIASDSSGILRSTDGISWTRVYQGGKFTSIVFYNGVWNAGGSYSYTTSHIYSIDNGLTWELVTKDSSSNTTNIYYSDGLWVLGTESKGIYYSIDGINWTVSNISNGSYRVFKAGGTWIAGSVSYQGSIYYSLDGKNWTLSNLVYDKASSTPLNGYNVESFASGNGIILGSCTGSGYGPQLFYSQTFQP